jgi:hypothetical protein
MQEFLDDLTGNDYRIEELPDIRISVLAVREAISMYAVDLNEKELEQRRVVDGPCLLLKYESQ